MSDQIPDTKPGFYYVSALDGPRSARVRGPYPTHAEALAAVEPAREQLVDLDPKAHFYAFGTCRSDTDLGPGYLNVVAPAAAPVAPLACDECEATTPDVRAVSNKRRNANVCRTCAP